jgi:hypothetical protein
MIERMVHFLESITVFWGAFQSAVGVELCVALTDAYNITTVRSWYQSPGMDCILFHVKFEGELSNPVLRNNATFYKKIGV